MGHERVYQIVMKEDEITWQTILQDLVKNKELNPWDVDVSLLAEKYLETIKEMQEMNLFVSGKMLLASAILLKIKSDKLLTEGIPILDNIMYPQEEVHQFEMDGQGRLIMDERPRLTIKTPQARKRRVNISDLMNALDKALEVNERRIKRFERRNWVPDVVIPEKGEDIEVLISRLFDKVKEILLSKNKVKFSELIPTQSKKDKILTFVPLLHLANQTKVDLYQETHFGDIDVSLKQ